MAGRRLWCGGWRPGTRAGRWRRLTARLGRAGHDNRFLVLEQILLVPLVGRASRGRGSSRRRHRRLPGAFLPLAPPAHDLLDERQHEEDDEQEEQLDRHRRPSRVPRRYFFGGWGGGGSSLPAIDSRMAESAWMFLSR